MGEVKGKSVGKENREERKKMGEGREGKGVVSEQRFNVPLDTL